MKTKKRLKLVLGVEFVVEDHDNPQQALQKAFRRFQGAEDEAVDLLNQKHNQGEPVEVRIERIY